MNKHTPGPWRWDENEACDLFSVFGAGGVLVVEMPLNGFSELRGQARADARLMAAAPEMLEALRACDDAFATWQVGGIPGRPEDILALIQRAREAIAKATGQ